MPYSLTEVVKDGLITVPRWSQHLVKVATSFLVFAALLAFGTPSLAAGVLGGPILWLALATKERIWPSDPAVYPLAMHMADWANDCALATLGGLVPALVLAHDIAQARLLALICVAIWAIVTTISYVTGEPYARP